MKNLLKPIGRLAGFMMPIGRLAVPALLMLTLRVMGQEPIPRHEENLSARNEVGIAIEKGLVWLRQHQNGDGSWSLNDYPALTALPLWAYMGNPQGGLRGRSRIIFGRGMTLLWRRLGRTGGIYRKGLANYNTSISLVALVLAQDPKYDPLIRRRTIL